MNNTFTSIFHEAVIPLNELNMTSKEDFNRKKNWDKKIKQKEEDHIVQRDANRHNASNKRERSKAPLYDKEKDTETNYKDSRTAYMKYHSYTHGKNDKPTGTNYSSGEDAYARKRRHIKESFLGFDII